MANTWNELSWGLGDWGLQNDTLIIPNGVVSSVSVNSVEYSGELGGWGQFTWGFNEWGDLINPNVDVTGLQINTFTGNEDSFTDVSLTLSTNLISSTVNTVTLVAGALEEPTFVLINTTAGTVFAGENVIVEVTTPGTATTWGQNAWGSAAWNQITGTVIQQGDESISGTGIVDLTGVQSNTSIGTFTVTGDANLSLNTNLLNVTAASILAVIDITVEVTSPGQLPWGTTSWGYGSWGNIGGMDVEQGGEEVVVPSVEVDVIGNQLNTTIGIYSITGDANLTLNTNLLTVGLGNEDATPNTIVTLSTNLLSSSVGTASGETLSLIDVTGVNMTASTGRLYVTAWAVVDIGVTNTWAVVDIAA
jgi:hypothetical protein